MKPCLLLFDAAQSQLSLLAVAQGWRVEHEDDQLPTAHAAADACMDACVAVVILGDASFGPSARERFPGALIVGTNDACREVADLSFESWEIDKRLFEQFLTHAEAHWRMHQRMIEAERAVETRQLQMHQLNEIGVALSSQMSLGDLLDTLLTEARGIAHCDGASLYLVETKLGNEQLVFKLTQNASIDLPFIEATVPLSCESIAGYVAVSGELLNLVDAYCVPADAPYTFNRTFDEKMGYRTRSMLVLPMRDHVGKVVGVLQFINRKNPENGHIVEFDQEIVEIVRGIAAQAALSIVKSRLVRDINNLFESFVQASVKAIEQRDPSTSGHSARVAESTVDLLLALPRSNLPRFRDLVFAENHLREVRYAALLHDFGKVGVREAVLIKSHKLTEERVEILHYRMQLAQERLRHEAVVAELHLLHDGAVDFEVARARVHRELQKQLSLLDDYFSMIVAANNPTVRSDGDFTHLRAIHNHSFVEADGSETALISRQDLSALSVRRGSLTPEERKEIEAHVQHTKDFLAVLPWPAELSQVPLIAGAHHEKLNGAGYPLGLAGDEIPLASRVMTVADIFDALTAMDRPYKTAVGEQLAYDILYEEAHEGLLDFDIVNVFVESRAQRRQRLAGT